ncbi:chondroadherin [Uranotaenia lowii]|uniref:chondroadherin n=1 Tax=Uranotaenia lowii TaxID=190385 RepID=UPI002478A02B|nr:chondroadherin [Uranotaenia lowii]XP_055602601.1 chondroadherin [Uranotaenia lowii]
MTPTLPKLLTRSCSGKHVLLALGALVTLTLSYANGFATLASELDKPQRCTLERSYKMVGYNCANLNLKEIPQSLKSTLEIFDLSFNRIRDLNRQSFTRYPDVKYLYLFENMIQNIEEGTFSELTSLEAIDLSNNALKTIPLEFFRLPLLRNLYVAHNALLDLVQDMDRLQKPIAAPLQVLNLADCWLQRLPNFGIMPDLWQLNISFNPLVELTIDQFAPMCNLKSLDMNGTQTPICACQTITTELTARRTKIVSSNPHCTLLFSSEQSICAQEAEESLVSVAPVRSEYQQCLEVRSSRKRDTEAKTAWFRISMAVLACIVVFSLILYYFHRRNVKNMKRKQNAYGGRYKAPPGGPDTINRVKVPSLHENDDHVSIIENGKCDKLLKDCD